MHMLYDSDSFAVMAMQADPDTQKLPNYDGPVLERNGFEIVDKRRGRQLYLDGSWAEMFQQQILAWQANTPTQEEVEETLESYTGLAQNPVVLH
jgi:hypothetical protein